MLLMPSSDFLRLELLPNSNRTGSLGPFHSFRGLVPLVDPSGEPGILAPGCVLLLEDAVSGRSERGSEALMRAALFSDNSGDRGTP